MSDVPKGYLGHARDIAKMKAVPDPNIIIHGSACVARVFLMTTRYYNVTEDRGEDYRGAERYLHRCFRDTELEARRAAALVSMGRPVS